MNIYFYKCFKAISLSTLAMLTFMTPTIIREQIPYFRFFSSQVFCLKDSLGNSIEVSGTLSQVTTTTFEPLPNFRHLC